MSDMKKLIKDVKKAFEKNGFQEPAFVISFAEKSTDHQMAFWCSNVKRMDAIKLTGIVHERLIKELN